MTFLSKSYSLGSFSQSETSALWECVSGGETVDNWTTLISLMEHRYPGSGRPELDHWAEVVMRTYKSNGGQIQVAKQMKDKAGVAFYYVVVAYDEPENHRFEMDFVRFGLGQKNGYTMTYAVRVSDRKDYRGKNKEFMEQHSAEIAQAIETAVVPDMSKLPRK
jgi:hypothetical protein